MFEEISLVALAAHEDASVVGVRDPTCAPTVVSKDDITGSGMRIGRARLVSNRFMAHARGNRIDGSRLSKLHSSVRDAASSKHGANTLAKKTRKRVAWSKALHAELRRHSKAKTPVVKI